MLTEAVLCFCDHRYAYSRLKWLGNKMLSFAVTMLFVSLWHGLWPGYFLCFFHELVCVQAERQVREYVCV